MNRFAKLALLLCFALAASGVSRAALAATVDAQISARLDALEKENAALRARLNRLELSTAAIRHRSAAAQSNPALASVSGPQNANALAADAGQVVGARTLNSRPHFEVSGSLLFLQPGSGNLEYGTLVTPLPIATPNWSNQSLSPNFDPAFRVGARYMPNESNDIELNWTHLNTTTNASFSAAPTQMVGPPYLIGPESAHLQER